MPGEAAAEKGKNKIVHRAKIMDLNLFGYKDEKSSVSYLFNLWKLKGEFKLLLTALSYHLFLFTPL